VNRSEIVAAARRIYAARYAAVIPEVCGCLFWAAAFIAAARRRGVQAQMRAGSANFQFRHDDGVSATHFSYEFEPGPAMQRFLDGLFPEMHVWAVVESPEEIVDLTTRFLPQQAKSLCNFEWESQFAPPEYFWSRPEGLAPRFIYRAEPRAVWMAAAFLRAFNIQHDLTGMSQPEQTGKHHDGQNKEPAYSAGDRNS
jgi:hypothetical protein